MQVKELIRLLKSAPKESEVCILLDKNIIEQNANKMNSDIFQVGIVGIEENDDYVELELDLNL